MNLTVPIVAQLQLFFYLNSETLHYSAVITEVTSDIKIQINATVSNNILVTQLPSVWEGEYNISGYAFLKKGLDSIYLKLN